MIQVLFGTANIFLGIQWAYMQSHDYRFAFLGGISGLFLSLIILWSGEALGKISAKSIIGGFLGLCVGLITANMIVYSFFLGSSFDLTLRDTFKILLSMAFGYLGTLLGIRKGGELGLGEEGKKTSGPKRYSENNFKILDTSVIIDGRIADICETGFIEGSLVIPQFVLKELQYIADSSDSVRRNRGRRGLEILHQIQKNADLDVQIIDQDFPKLKEVDTKLVALGKLLSGKILTNDFNLNKIAELQGVTVLNINQLTNALKPVVLPGEIMNVFVLREGKEYGQGVGYLDDGTMVVIDNAKKHIGRNVEVAVTSILQTTAGRMIFARLKEEIERGKAEHTSSLWAFSKAKEEEGQGR